MRPTNTCINNKEKCRAHTQSNVKHHEDNVLFVWTFVALQEDGDFESVTMDKDPGSLNAAIKQQKGARPRFSSINEPSSATPGSVTSCTSSDSRKPIRFSHSKYMFIVMCIFENKFVSFDIKDDCTGTCTWKSND